MKSEGHTAFIILQLIIWQDPLLAYPPLTIIFILNNELDATGIDTAVNSLDLFEHDTVSRFCKDIQAIITDFLEQPVFKFMMALIEPVIIADDFKAGHPVNADVF